MNYLSKENVQEVLNLTRMKDHLLADETASTTAGAQIAQVTLRLAGSIDAARLQQAWDHVIESHAELRSVYRSMKGRLVQVVLKQRPIPLDVHDMRGRSAEDVHARLEKTLLAQLAPMVPSEGPLMRLALVQTEDAQGVLVWTYHQMVLDEQSRQFVITDVLATYEALAQGRALPAFNRPQVKEYIKWLAGQDWSDVKTVWTEQLAGFEVPTQLLGGPRMHLVTELRDVQQMQFSSQLSQQLNKLAAQHGVTGETLAHAAWALLLNVYSSEEIVFYGATLSGRPEALRGSDALVGRFGNTLPAKVTVDGEQTVADLLRAMQAQQLVLQKYAHLPLDDVREYSGLDAGATLFASAIAVRNGQEASGAASSLQMEIDQWGGETIPLTIEVQLGETWQVVFSTAKQAWDADTVKRMQAHFVTLLESMATQPHARVRELNVLPAAEREQLFVDFTETLLPQPDLSRLAHQVIEDQVAKTPDRIACEFNGESLTYQEVNERANRLAHWLREQGFGRNDLVAMFAERGSDMLIAILAVMKAGGAYVPLDTAHPDSRLRTIVENSQAKVIFTQKELTERSKALANGLSPEPIVYCLDQAMPNSGVADVQTLQGYSTENPAFVNEPDDLANVFFTSGSTGLPKGAMVEHLGMVNHLYSKIHLNEIDENSVVVQNASHCFDISVWQFIAPLMVGGKCVIYGNEIAGDPHALLTSVKRDGATVLEMVPAMIEMFLFAAGEMDEQERALPTLTYMIATGEALPVTLVQKWVQVYPQIKVVNAYGYTECSDDTCHALVDGTSSIGRSTCHLGRPIPNSKTYLLDRWNRPVPIGCAGEICVTGIVVGRGYLNDPERTAKAFVENPFDDGMVNRMYRSGDLGRFTTDGELYFVSRIDHQVKVRGHRIELGEVESALRSNAAVSLCVAIVRPDNHGQNRILAYVVGEDLQVDALRELLHSRLPEYMIPEHIVVLDEMPLNRNGKIDRKALPDPQEVGGRTADTLAGPRNEIEAELVRIYEDVLGTSPIGIEDNFFHLGGHSLRTVQVRSRVKHALGVDIPLKKLFDLQSVAELGAYIARMTGQGIDGEQPIPRVPRAASYPMSHAQRRLYFLHLLDPQSIAYNMPQAFEVRGAFQFKAFRQAFQAIVDRHDSLRTTFVMEKGEPVQRVAAKLAFTYQASDLSKLTSEEQQRAVQAFLYEDRHQPFDLENGPLLRVRLLKLGTEHHILMVNKHHIISDRLSWQVLQREFVTIYEGLLVGAAPSDVLMPLTIQYVDFSEWQNQRVANGELATQEQYWLNKLSGELPVLAIPTDFPRPPIQQYNGAYVTKALPKEMVAGIGQLTEQHDATLFMVLLAATGVLLNRLSGQHDIILGTPEAGRNRMELEELIGFFINTLPLRMDVQPQETFMGLLEQVKQTALDAYEHQEYPFNLLVDKLNVPRDLSRAPIVSAMFQVVRHIEPEPLPGLQLTNVPLDMETSQNDLYFAFIETPEGIDMVIDYSTDLFSHDTVASWTLHFEQLMSDILANPQLPLAQVAQVEDSERKRLAQGNGVEESAVACLHEQFEGQVQRTPDAAAVVFANGGLAESLSYAELNRRANLVAHHLQEQGILPGQPVVVRMERSLELMIAVLGVLKAGGTYVPIDPQLTADHVKRVLEDTQTGVVLTQQHLMYALPRTGAKVICVDADWARIAEASGENLASGVKLQQAAYVIYGVDFSEQAGGLNVDHRSASNLLSVQKEASGLTADSRVLQFASISSELSLFEMFASLTSGATLVLASKDTLHADAKLAALLREQKLSFALLTPERLASLNPVELPALQVVGVVGEVSTNALAETWAAGRTFLTMHGRVGVTFSEYVAPRDELEKQLQRLMEELLDVRPIGVHDNFFDLGGHSFLGVSLLARIRDEFGIELPLPSLFEAGTIERMAQYMQDAAQEALDKVVPVEA